MNKHISEEVLFVKYLPIEGKIQKGDTIMVTHAGSGKWHKCFYVHDINGAGVVKLMENPNNTHYFCLNIKDMIRVSLFLCSSRFFSGDTVTKFKDTLDFEDITYSTELGGPTERDNVLLVDDSAKGFRHQFCRKLGFISDGAHWLLDLEILKREEIELFFEVEGGIFPSRMEKTLYDNPRYKDKIKRFYKVKCENCKNYH